MTVERVSLPFGAIDLEMETGHLAKQAHGAVVAVIGETTALVAVTHSDEPQQGRDFFPLMVDYREKFYASGRIPGGFFRREGRPGDPETIKARITDRALRPLFPAGMRHEIMVYITIISSDNINPADVAAFNAASLALQISDIPFPVPVAGVRVGYEDGNYILNPTFEQLEKSELDLMVCGTREAINMVEAGAKEVSEEVILGGLKFGHEAIVKILDAMIPFVKKAGKPKFDPATPQVPEDVRKKITELGKPRFTELVKQGATKEDYGRQEHQIVKEIAQEFAESHADLKGPIRDVIEEVHGEAVRTLVCGEKKRVDGRSFTEIRPIQCEVSVLPQTHGSALFTRGQTQALGVVTLGTIDEAQKIDNMLGISSKRFLMHYNFPPWSVGEARPMRASSRREIGHGALAERALAPILPDLADFPYTVRIVSEILESNGSSSMATVCAACLSMMDAGIPIKKPVAGIAMGLVAHGDQMAVLTDIQGVEDHLGDMDFKVTGTRDGITALQMDIKIESVSAELLSQALQQAKDARFQILDSMKEALAAPRPELSPNAPRLTVLKIPTSKIGMVIGPGGKTIRSIIEQTGVKIDVEDDGTVYIASKEADAAKAAEEMVLKLTEEVEMGKVYKGKVVRVENYGAFVQLLPNKDGLLPISELEMGRVDRVEDVCDMGDEIEVKVINIDDMGRVRVSRRALLAEAAGEPYEPSVRPGGSRGGPRGGGGRGGPRSGGRGGPGGPRGGGRGGDRGGERGPARSGMGFRERPRSKD